MPTSRLYLISPARIDHPTIFADDLRSALDGGDVAAFLLHLADADEAAIVRAADILRPVCQQRGVAFFIAARADLGVKLDFDGVHLEADGLSCAEARRIVGPDRQVGIACPSSRHFAMEAAEQGADYVAFDSTDLEMIEWWSSLFEIPCVAIGKVAVENTKPLLTAGADFLAVGDGIWQFGEGPQAAVGAFDALLQTA